MRRPRPAILVLAASIAVLLAVPIAVAGTSQHAASDVEAVGSRPTTQPAVANERKSQQVTFQRVTAEPREPAPHPVGLSIERLGIDATVVPSGVTEDGQAEVPEDVDLVGWYQFGRSPGDAEGSVVLVGHRDGRVGGPGVFYSVGALNVGDVLEVTDEAGEQWRYVVQSRESIERTTLPVDELFTRTGEPMLVLISCGGIYDRTAGGYRDNIVITARPVADEA